MPCSPGRTLRAQLIYRCAGFNVETVEYKNISFTVWDVGGQDKVRPSGGLNAFFECSFPICAC
jgi:GTPase SAR1 family protein